MKIAIKDKIDLGPKLARLLHRLTGENVDELILFATPDVVLLIKKLLAKSNVITEIHISDKTIYIARGMKIQIETIDRYE